MKKFKLFFAGIGSMALAPMAFAVLMVCNLDSGREWQSDPCISESWDDCRDWFEEIVLTTIPNVIFPTFVRAETGVITIAGPNIEVKVEMLDIRYSGGDFATAILNGEEKVELRLDSVVQFEGPGFETTVEELLDMAGNNPRQLARIFL